MPLENDIRASLSSSASLEEEHVEDRSHTLLGDMDNVRDLVHCSEHLEVSLLNAYCEDIGFSSLLDDCKTQLKEYIGSFIKHREKKLLAKSLLTALEDCHDVNQYFKYLLLAKNKNDIIVEASKRRISEGNLSRILKASLFVLCNLLNLHSLKPKKAFDLSEEALELPEVTLEISEKAHESSEETSESPDNTTFSLPPTVTFFELYNHNAQFRDFAYNEKRVAFV